VGRNGGTFILLIKPITMKRYTPANNGKIVSITKCLSHRGMKYIVLILQRLGSATHVDTLPDAPNVSHLRKTSLGKQLRRLQRQICTVIANNAGNELPNLLDR
jgi:hypothetical protein